MRTLLPTLQRYFENALIDKGDPMILRIFKVQIRDEQRNAFEKDFLRISVEAVENEAGFISCEIGFPTLWHPNEYVMITKWENQQALVKFAGSNWNVPVIPKPMEQYVVSCSVEHYELPNPDKPEIPNIK